MGYYTTAEIVKIVNKLIDRCGTRDPYKVAKELGINIIYRDFEKQRGAYKVILKNRFVFLKNGMHPVVEQIVLWHEIGHDVLHRQEAVAVGGFKEFNIFDMRENRMEYEANIFASQASLPDDTILWCCIIKVDTLFSRILIYNHNQYENRRKTYGTESKIL